MIEDIRSLVQALPLSVIRAVAHTRGEARAVEMFALAAYSRTHIVTVEALAITGKDQTFLVMLIPRAIVIDARHTAICL